MGPEGLKEDVEHYACETCSYETENVVFDCLWCLVVGYVFFCSFV